MVLEPCCCPEMTRPASLWVQKTGSSAVPVIIAIFFFQTAKDIVAKVFKCRKVKTNDD